MCVILPYIQVDESITIRTTLNYLHTIRIFDIQFYRIKLFPLSNYLTMDFKQIGLV